MSSDQMTRQEFQRLKALSSSDPLFNKAFRSVPYQRTFDTNRDGVLDAKDFDRDKDGTLRGQELRQLFRFMDRFDHDGSAHSIAKQGKAGGLLKAARGASNRYRSAKLATSGPSQPTPSVAVKRALSCLRGSLSPAKLSKAREELMKLERDGGLRWLQQTHLTPARQKVVLLQQLAHPTHARHLSALASDKSLVPATMSASRFQLVTQLVGVRGPVARTLLSCGFDTSKTRKLAHALLMSETFASKFRSADNKALFCGRALDKMEQFAKSVQTIGKGFAPVAEVNNTEVATRALQKEPWLLYSLSPRKAQSVLTGILREFGKGLKYKQFQAQGLRATLKSLKADNPSCYKCLFLHAYQTLTKNPLPQQKNHEANLVASLVAGKVHPSLAWGFVATAGISSSLGASQKDSLRNAALTSVVSALGSLVAPKKSHIGAWITALMSTLETTTDLLKNEDSQTGLLSALRAKENWSVFP